MFKFPLTVREEETIPAYHTNTYDSDDQFEEHHKIYDIIEEELPPNELCSGVHWIAKSSIENVSDQIFPGGKLTDMKFEQPLNGGYSISREMDDITIPELKPDEKVTFSLDIGIPKKPGTAQVEVNLETSVDGGFVDPDGEEFGDSLFYTYSIVDREKLRMLNRLSSLNNTGGE